MADRKTNIKRQNFIQLILSLVIIILINVISSFVFTRIDLTSENRYSISPATKEVIKKLDDIVYFKVYLEGDFHAGFKRLRNETKEMLDEFRAYNDNIQYEFINPSKADEENNAKDTYKILIKKGLQPTTLEVKTEEGNSQQVIFPGALVTYKGREIPVRLLMDQYGTPPEDVLNNSIQSLEYNLSKAIKTLTSYFKPPIAFIEGHGELDKMQVADITQALSENYEVSRIKINHKLDALNTCLAIIIAKPDSAFDEKDKFIIDQFIMRGGKVLWLIDPIFASMDSLVKSSETVGFARNFNLQDMLFKYGVRINANLIMDLNALPIPVITGMVGNQPQYSPIPWLYFPVCLPTLNHPITNNLNSIKFEFVSSLDTVFSNSAKKTFLLTSSKYTKLINTPARITLEVLRKKPIVEQYNKGYQNVGVLIEGQFESVFKNRIPEIISNDKSIGFKEKSVPNKMIVFSDGDIIKNQLQNVQGKYYPLPLGYDKYTRQTFGNKDLILNAMDYLCDGSGLIVVRSKELKLRLLDKTIVQKNKLLIQTINVVLPVLLIIIIGIIIFTIRKRKYTNN